eukprot:CAMPEP_0118921592 /NCGR_PEP_ID=MMETSP1169-20130426/813_1 /TAXON_ID=36882 /ORGANISM="Pyramimonas obovata, Strain CCMP722" /LENGTH=175 /DNA_ID=CAMNT_0006862341 /DNA_START=136 /DNA_END=661 /DNA_ORIENTATION=+
MSPGRRVGSSAIAAGPHTSSRVWYYNPHAGRGGDGTPLLGRVPATRGPTPQQVGSGAGRSLMLHPANRPGWPCGNCLSTRDHMRALEGPSDFRMFLLAGGDEGASLKYPRAVQQVRGAGKAHGERAKGWLKDGGAGCGWAGRLGHLRLSGCPMRTRSTHADKAEHGDTHSQNTRW